MSNNRTPIVTLNITQWMAITARMPRMVKSVYHDICLYSWETARPVPDAELVLMLADTEGQGDKIVDALVKSGGLERDEHGNVWSVWALDEATRAYALWLKKSNGGKIAGENRRAEAASDVQVSIAPAVVQVPVRSIKTIEKRDADAPNGIRIEALPPEAFVYEQPVGKKPISAGACAEVFASWNAVAKPAGLPIATKMTGSREGAIRARIEELGTDTITQALAIVPKLALNTKVSDLDWFLRPATIPGIISGDFTPMTNGG